MIYNRSIQEIDGLLSETTKRRIQQSTVFSVLVPESYDIRVDFQVSYAKILNKPFAIICINKREIPSGLLDQIEVFKVFYGSNEFRDEVGEEIVKWIKSFNR